MEKEKRNPFINKIFGKQFLINPNFQYKFMFSLTMAAVLSMSVLYAAQSYFFQYFLNRAQTAELPPNHVFFHLLKEQQMIMGQIFFVSTIVIGAILFFWGLFYSHRIAGPLYRIDRDLREAASNGQSLMSLKTRDSDFFQEIPEAINLYCHSHDGWGFVRKNNEEEEDKVAS
ncbi:MAG: hypothetical protein CME70_04185 [Halobacteriovorax sp.]|nr:hypothetical protein [Halobacteriovorax sp.]